MRGQLGSSLHWRALLWEGHPRSGGSISAISYVCAGILLIDRFKSAVGDFVVCDESHAKDLTASKCNMPEGELAKVDVFVEMGDDRVAFEEGLGVWASIESGDKEAASRHIPSRDSFRERSPFDRI